MYCKWSGKRLCGAIGGGPAPYDFPDGAPFGQWYVACSSNGTFAYPYGPTHVPGACNEDSGAPALVMSYPQCVTDSGAFDLSGNLWEWEDSCEPQGGDPKNQACRARGGAYDNDFPATCDFGGKNRARNDNHQQDIGIRCCSP
jgi:formylglycine-generating enzyme required for sulfatase activity